MSLLSKYWQGFDGQVKKSVKKATKLEAFIPGIGMVTKALKQQYDEATTEVKKQMRAAAKKKKK